MNSSQDNNPKKPSSVAKGRESVDANIDGSLVAFINKNITPYPTDVGGPSFDLIPVERQKDIMVNVARLHAQQELNRIMQLVEVLQKQAAQLQRRLELTDAVHAAKYEFQIYHNQCYWLVRDTLHNCTRLTHNGPQDWSTGKPTEWEYMGRMRWLGDYSWQEVDDQGNFVDL